jgi:hypothetical protein
MHVWCDCGSRGQARGRTRRKTNGAQRLNVNTASGGGAGSLKPAAAAVPASRRSPAPPPRHVTHRRWVESRTPDPSCRQCCCGGWRHRCARSQQPHHCELRLRPNRSHQGGATAPVRGFQACTRPHKRVHKCRAVGGSRQVERRREGRVISVQASRDVCAAPERQQTLHRRLRQSVDAHRRQCRYQQRHARRDRPAPSCQRHRRRAPPRRRTAVGRKGGRQLRAPEGWRGAGGGGGSAPGATLRAGQKQPNAAEAATPPTRAALPDAMACMTSLPADASPFARGASSRASMPVPAD